MVQLFRVTCESLPPLIVAFRSSMPFSVHPSMTVILSSATEDGLVSECNILEREDGVHRSVNGGGGGCCVVLCCVMIGGGGVSKLKLKLG
jgi:hypothetical protein